jgi:hypothetical protein
VNERRRPSARSLVSHSGKSEKMTDRLQAIDVISFARFGNEIALLDAATRSAYERGFEAMREIALNAVRPKVSHSDLTVADFSWPEAPRRPPERSGED